MPFDLAIIGAGSAAMYYLAARMSGGLSQEQKQEYRQVLTPLMKEHVKRPSVQETPEALLQRHLDSDDVDFSKTALVGYFDPWDTKHGHEYAQMLGRGGNYPVNHTRQIISTRPLSSLENTLSQEQIAEEWSSYFAAPDYQDARRLFKQSQGYTRREDFHDEWADVIARAKVRGLTRNYGFCTKIQFDRKTGLFTLTYDDIFEKAAKKLEAREVMLAMGGGGYMKPDRGFKMPPEWEKRPDILDLDQLMRFLVTTPKKNLNIVIQGANAAIDGIEQALRYGHQVHWIARSAPRILPNTLLHHTKKLIEGGSAGYTPVGSGKVSKLISGVSSTELTTTMGGKLHLKVYTDTDFKTLKAEHTDVDVYVYAIGQDPATATIGAKKLLTDSAIKSEDLQLIYDEGWHFRENNKHAWVKDAAIGLRKTFQADGGSAHNLDILGASSFILGNEEQRNKLLYTVYYEIPSVADVRQLGAIRDVMRAYCKILSGVHIDPSNINFLGGSKDELAAFIAMYYADIPPMVADDVVTFLSLVRTRSAFTNGYTQGEINGIKQALAAIARFFTEGDGREWAEALKKVEKLRRGYHEVLEGVFKTRDAKVSWSSVGPRKEFQ